MLLLLLLLATALLSSDELLLPKCKLCDIPIAFSVGVRFLRMLPLSLANDATAPPPAIFESSRERCINWFEQHDVADEQKGLPLAADGRVELSALGAFLRADEDWVSVWLLYDAFAGFSVRPTLGLSE